MVSVIHDSRLSYPDGTEFYSPSEQYPEYPFAHIASRPNLVYQTVRNCLAQAGLDRGNYGRPSWNPLRYAISANSNVFVLCNFVYHRRPRETLGDFCSKCTHGSVLRAVLDYVLLAVGEKGIVRFGNAPVQSCDWQRVLDDTGSAIVADFYKHSNQYVVEACDLRSHIVKRNSLNRLTPVYRGEPQDEVEIDLGKDSLLEELYTARYLPKFRSLDYDPQLTDSYHEEGKHIYVLNRRVLDADIIVSIPKLKTHEKTGVTLGIKNCVGAIAHKHCLAHFRLGSPCRGGDEYEDGQFLNWWESQMGESTYKQAKSAFADYRLTVVFLLRKVIHYVLGRNVGGGWVGNDTTWRMGMDIARILTHCQKSGSLSDDKRRKLICFIDGIVSGEGNGPLSPTANYYGYMSYSDDIASGDYVAACFMGLCPEELPIVQRALSVARYPLTDMKAAHIQAIVNGVLYDHPKLTSLGIRPFRLSAGWDKQFRNKAVESSANRLR